MRLFHNWRYFFVRWTLIFFHGIQTDSCNATTNNMNAKKDFQKNIGAHHPSTHETPTEESLDEKNLAARDKSKQTLIFQSSTPSQSSKNPETTEDFTNTFLQIVNRDHYIDKSLLIEALFDGTIVEPLLITAPEGFGKSVNLAMIYSFFSIPVSENGTKLPPSESPIARKFIDKKLKITRWPAFSTYFSSRGVLYLDFKKINSFHSIPDLRSRFYNVLRSSINMHPFLRDLKDTTTKNFIKRCYAAPVQRHKESSLVVCLDKFARILNKFYGNPVLVLIDEATAPHQWILTEQARRNGPWLTNSTIHEILAFTESAKAKLLKGNWFVWRSILTGVMSYGEEHHYYANNLVYKSAIRDKLIRPFYGLLGEEVDRLIALQPPTARDDLKKNIERYFDGYRYHHYHQDLSEDSLYSSRQIIHFLTEEKNYTEFLKGDLTAHCSPRSLSDFKYLLSPARFGQKFLDSLDPAKGVKIFGTTKLDSVALSALVDAESGVGKPAKHIEDVLFYYLMELGFYIVKEELDDYSWLLTVPNKVVEFAMRGFAERIVNPFLIGPGI